MTLIVQSYKVDEKRGLDLALYNTETDSHYTCLLDWMTVVGYVAPFVRDPFAGLPEDMAPYGTVRTR